MQSIESSENHYSLFHLTNFPRLESEFQVSLFDAKMRVMQITKDLIQHIAKLARIRLDDSQVQKFTQQMGDIVGFIEKLNSVDTTGIPETNQVNGMENVLREDEVENFPRMEELIACSNNPIENNQIKIKKSI
jgi:aspartyl-tRNA(Asn)/glutamyl-tRNA(Gln) amidotransferase subunit C